MENLPYLDARVAFTLGEDYAFYGMPLPTDTDESLRRGYQSGLERFTGHRPSADRFVRKWLQVRRGAWRRNRAFDVDVTPEYIKFIDNEVCPVSGVELTHATGLGTDWSIDRLNNDGAYAKYNLVVMSTRVNALKGTLAWREIASLANANQDSRGLTALEWCKLWRLVSATVIRHALPVRECLTTAQHPGDLLRVWSIEAQHTILSAAAGSASTRKVFWDWCLEPVPLSDRGCVAVLQKGLSHYTRTTPRHQQTIAGLFGPEPMWQAFTHWWSYFQASPNTEDLVKSVKRLGPKGNLLVSVSLADVARIHHVATKGYN